MRDNRSTTGAHVLLGVLKAAGVRCIFSLSGNQIMPLYDALLGSGIRIIHVRHEASAVYMAEAWAQLTGEIGVALVTAGAGFGNALGALISARASETPVLLLSGDSPRSQDGSGAFQELNQTAMAAPVTKISRRAQSADTLAEEAAAIIRCALSGRPGPVHLALPADVLTAPLDNPGAPDPTDLAPQPQPLSDGDAEAVAAFLGGGRYPLILTGPALSPTRRGDALDRLQRAFATPVLCMESPRGLRDPSLGALADVTRKADRLLLLGKAPDFTTGFLGQNMGAADAQVAMIDPDPAEIARGRARVGDRLALAIEADAVSALQRLLRGDVSAPDRSEWLSEAAEAIARRVDVPWNEAVDDRGLHPANVAAAVAARLARAPGSILICDGGEFGQWAQTISHTGPRIINGVSGAIGAGIAYAIGASIARPDSPVFALMGDGTAGFLLAEYETALRSGARFVAVIGNDDRWNAEYQIQIQEFGQDRTHTTDLSPATRYDAAAAGLGAHGEFVGQGDAAALDAALERALAAKRPACVNLRIRPVPAPVVACREPTLVPAH